MIKFDQAIQWNPINANALWGKAQALPFMEEYDMALNECQKALQVYPHNMAYRRKSNVYYGMDKYDLALNVYYGMDWMILH